MQNLLPEPPATLLPPDEAAEAALAEARQIDTDEAYASVAARFPTFSAAWGLLASRANAEGQVVTAYAYARTGYHRGLDSLRRHGWRGVGPIPWEHEPNRGFLRALYSLGRASAAIGEAEEPERIEKFLKDSDPNAKAAIEAR